MVRTIDNLESAFTEMYEFTTDLPSGLDGFESNFDEAFKELENLKVAIARPGKPLTLDQLKTMRGKWVWIISPDADMTVSAWAYVGENHVFTYLEDHDKLVVRRTYNICDYGAWLTYSYPPAQQQWIPVSERLPKTGTVLATDGKYVITAPSSSVTKDGPAITHWMPLPEPPERDEDERL